MTAKPIVPVWMDMADLAEFITPALAARTDWPFAIQFVNAAAGRIQAA